MEAATGFEPVIRVLQTHALPLGYAAAFRAHVYACAESRVSVTGNSPRGKPISNRKLAARIARAGLYDRDTSAIGSSGGGNERDKEHRDERNNHEKEHAHCLYHSHGSSSTQ
jgi:hypothetical protein